METTSKLEDIPSDFVIQGITTVTSEGNIERYTTLKESIEGLRELASQINKLVEDTKSKMPVDEAGQSLVHFFLDHTTGIPIPSLNLNIKTIINQSFYEEHTKGMTAFEVEKMLKA